MLGDKGVVLERLWPILGTAERRQVWGWEEQGVWGLPGEHSG